MKIGTLQIDALRDVDRVAQRIDQREVLQDSGMLLIGVVRPDSSANGIMTTKE